MSIQYRSLCHPYLPDSGAKKQHSFRSLHTINLLNPASNGDGYKSCFVQFLMVHAGAGSVPEWNETFVFTVSEGTKELSLKIMDKDTISEDDFLGETSISLEPVFVEGNLQPTSYNVVKDSEYRGEIRVGLTFTPQEDGSRRLDTEDSYGGWKESAYGN
ncbi:hypothetical protein Tsubulata_020019 [Turnera subulata]|uniref:C2 domain-containing protein n=1 Tax=Turnera subulata TaxID=218843 RepID=A0A9Q0G5T9_9ROSI|nr:hypothetical protein Tsubulata_020019 [Turnera subulata]